MKKAIIYSKDYCPYCVKAKNTLDQLGVSYTEVNLQEQPERMEEMLELTGGAQTVPQIFFHVGGSDDLHQLLEEGKLDGILNQSQN